ncbi:MAG: hypothetical protein KAR31_05820, partial [Candidatus Omnitrophica bacterium]|nr:hypothetical protein [Candidatus Omnitrophota bacterium]
ISKCCMDLKGATAYADLRENTLEEIWNSNIRRQFLSAMFYNKRSTMAGCCTCSITYTNNDNRHTNIMRSLKRRLLSVVKGKDYYLKPLK